MPPPGLKPRARAPIIIALVVIACGALVAVGLCNGSDSTPDAPRHAF